MPPSFIPEHNLITTKTRYLPDTRCIPLKIIYNYRCENRLPKRYTARAKACTVCCRSHNALFDQIPLGAQMHSWAFRVCVLSCTGRRLRRIALNLAFIIVEKAVYEHSLMYWLKCSFVLCMRVNSAVFGCSCLARSVNKCDFRLVIK